MKKNKLALEALRIAGTFFGTTLSIPSPRISTSSHISEESVKNLERTYLAAIDSGNFTSITVSYMQFSHNAKAKAAFENICQRMSERGIKLLISNVPIGPDPFVNQLTVQYLSQFDFEMIASLVYDSLNLTGGLKQFSGLNNPQQPESRTDLFLTIDGRELGQELSEIYLANVHSIADLSTSLYDEYGNYGLAFRSDETTTIEKLQLSSFAKTTTPVVIYGSQNPETLASLAVSFSTPETSETTSRRLVLVALETPLPENYSDEAIKEWIKTSARSIQLLEEALTQVA